MIGQVMVHVELPLYRASPTFLTNPSFLPITYMRHLVLSVTAPRSYFQLRVSLESPLVACYKWLAEECPRAEIYCVAALEPGVMHG